MPSTRFAARTLGRTAARLVGAGAAVGAAGLTWSLVEAQAFTVRRVEIPCLPSGHRPLRVLHVTDFHVTPTQRRKLAWIKTLRDLDPDLVVNTGDNLAHRGSVPPLVDALGPLLDVPGVFVYGSNDYYAPVLKSPHRYLLPDDGKRFLNRPMLAYDDLRRRFTDRGWLDLNNADGWLEVGGTRIAFTGLDDPHIDRDQLDTVEAAPAGADLRVGVVHAPYLRVLDAFAARGWDLTFAGHTHGGQLCLPFAGAIVTNCDLERGRAKGLHRHPADSAPGDDGSTWLHVCAGAGTSPYTPVRFCCRPEATLATLVAAEDVALAPAA